MKFGYKWRKVLGYTLAQSKHWFRKLGIVIKELTIIQQKP